MFEQQERRKGGNSIKLETKNSHEDAQYVLLLRISYFLLLHSVVQILLGIDFHSFTFVTNNFR